MGEQAKRRGLHPLAWIGIGCGGLIVVAGLLMLGAGFFVASKVKAGLDEFSDNPAITAAAAAIRLNPELELMEVDKEAGTLTVRNTKTGEELTVDLSDLSQGKLVFSGEEGAVTVQGGDSSLTLSSDDGEMSWGDAAYWEQVPEWIPRYPGSDPEGYMTGGDDRSSSGALPFRTQDDAGAVIDFYRQQLEKATFRVSSTALGGAGTRVMTLEARDSDENRSLQVIATEAADGPTQVMLNFSSKRP
ncbi:MAG: hypothetical protein Q9Q40_07950 [Acidobacteriota bacterium]|nr:hypothetical protein [Acidobacteriota bacterium]